MTAQLAIAAVKAAIESVAEGKVVAEPAPSPSLGDPVQVEIIGQEIQPRSTVDHWELATVRATPSYKGLRTDDELSARIQALTRAVAGIEDNVVQVLPFSISISWLPTERDQRAAQVDVTLRWQRGLTG